MPAKPAPITRTFKRSALRSLQHELQLANGGTTDVEACPADGSKDRGDHEEQTCINTEELACGDHAVGGKADDAEHQEAAQQNAQKAHGRVVYDPVIITERTELAANFAQSCPNSQQKVDIQPTSACCSASWR